LPGGKVLSVVDTLDPPAARHTDLGCWHCAWATKALTTHQMLSTSPKGGPFEPFPPFKGFMTKTPQSDEQQLTLVPRLNRIERPVDVSAMRNPSDTRKTFTGVR